MQQFFFVKEYNALVKELGEIAPPITTSDFGEMWQTILDFNKNKQVFGNEKTEVAQLSQMYIAEYIYFSMAVGFEGYQNQVQTLLKPLLLDIANTAMSIYKLAFDGFNYQAKVLLRNLYELCMTLLNVIVSPTKRTALFQSARDENDKQIWYKYFKPSKLQETLQEYERYLGESWSDEWHRRVYGHLSSYAHNDFLSFFLSAYATPKNEDEEMVLNVCGNFADRVEDLLDDMNAILFFTGMNLLKMLVDPNIDVTKEQICHDNSQDADNHEFWNVASFLELLNRKCYLKRFWDKHEEVE